MQKPIANEVCIYFTFHPSLGPLKTFDWLLFCSMLHVAAGQVLFCCLLLTHIFVCFMRRCPTNFRFATIPAGNWLVKKNAAEQLFQCEKLLTSDFNKILFSSCSGNSSHFGCNLSTPPPAHTQMDVCVHFICGCSLAFESKRGKGWGSIDAGGVIRFGFYKIALLMQKNSLSSFSGF